MTSRVLRSYLLLVRIDLTIRMLGFRRIYAIVQQRPTHSIPELERVPHERLCRAMDLACVFYPKTVMCLQRSIATVLFLRSYGWPVELVTGCQLSTFENHAWVELSNVVINDKPYMNEMYQVLDRC